MTDLTPRGVLRPATCAVCQGMFYSDTAWDHGQLVLLENRCGGCVGQGALFGGAE